MLDGKSSLSLVLEISVNTGKERWIDYISDGASSSLISNNVRIVIKSKYRWWLLSYWTSQVIKSTSLRPGAKRKFMIRPQLLATSESERSGSHGKVSFFYSVCSCRTGISGGLRQRPCGITEPKEEVKKWRGDRAPRYEGLPNLSP